MNTVQALIITFCVIIIGCIILFNLIQIAQIITRKSVSIRSIFLNFKQKMWMTIGLGICFFSLYVGLLYASSIAVNERLELFQKVYQNPLNSVYLGLSFFVAMTISSYLVRMLIIRVYYSKKR